MAYDVRSYSGEAQATSLLNAIGTTDTSFQVASASTWLEGPGYTNHLGTSGNFVLAVDFGTNTEEKILCSNVDTSAGTVTVVTRGYDGSSAQSHAAGAVAVPVLSAQEAYEANQVASQTLGQIAAANDLLVGQVAGQLTRLPAGAQGSVLKHNTSSLGWTAQGTAGQVLTSSVTDVGWASLAPAHLECYNTGSGQSVSQTSGAVTTTVALAASANSQGANPPTLASNVVTVHADGLYQINLTVEMVSTSSAVVVQPAVTVAGQQYHGATMVSNAGANTCGVVSVTVPLSSGGTITPQVISTAISSFSWTIAATEKATNLTVTRLGPLV